MKIYLSRSGKQFGPYTLESLERFRSEKSVADEDWAWAPGQKDWIPLSVLLAELKKLAPNDGETVLDSSTESLQVREEVPNETEIKNTPSEPARLIANPKEPDPVLEAAPFTAAITPSLEPPQLGRHEVGPSAVVSVGTEVGERPSRFNVRRFLLVCGATTLGLIVLSTIVTLVLMPEHVSITLGEGGLLVPDDGYQFVDPQDALDWRVRWAPGMPSSARTSVVTGKKEGTWLPAPGYERRSNKAPEHDLVWVPKKREPEYPHVAAGSDPGTWLPDPGYVMAGSASPTAPRVVWRNGVRLPHMVSAERENFWFLDPGYTFAKDSTTEHPKASWSPGRREQEFPHVVAGSDPGTWLPDPGYVMAGSASPTAPLVVWRKGVRLPRMVSAERENYWILDPGYTFAKDSTTEHPKASWSPGSRHYDNSHVYAAPAEGKWLADLGYFWLNSDVGDLRTFNAGRTIEIWRASHDIDASTNGLDCSSAAHVVSVIETARDRYGNIGIGEIHPLLAQHIVAAHAALKSGATTINACILADNAEPVADVAAALLCMFSDKPWNKCMEDSAPTRKIIGVAGKLGTSSCGGAFERFGKELDKLTDERRKMATGLQAQYGLELTAPVRILTCR